MYKDEKNNHVENNSKSLNYCLLNKSDSKYRII